MLEIPLIAPATPTVSFGLPHRVPESENPAATVLSTSINSYGSTLLLDIEANPAATRVAADGRDVGRLAGYRSQLRGILVAAHPAAAQKSSDRDFARSSPEIMAPLDFKDQLKLAKPRIQTLAVWDNREVKDAGA